MTEEEWLTVTDPDAILELLRGRTSERKLRLFLVGYARSIWEELYPEDLQTGVEVAERFADGLANKVALQEQSMAVHRLGMWSLIVNPDHERAYPIACACTSVKSLVTLTLTNKYAREQNNSDTSASQSIFLREVFGNPFRPVFFSAAWLTTTVVSLAQTIYDDRHLPSGLFDNQRMAVLADALEEAGCDNADILGHLRGGGDHVRGCWAVDLVLGKE